MNNEQQQPSNSLANNTRWNSVTAKRKKNFWLITQSEMNIFILLIVSIFLSETTIMIVLRFLPELSDWGEAILDASTLSILIFPVIYHFLFKPLKKSRAEHDRKESNYKTLVEHIGEGVVICDINEKFLFANSAAEKIFGTTKDGLIGLGLEEFFSEEDFTFMLTQRNNTKQRVYEAHIHLKNGTKKTILITANSQFENGIITGTLGIFRDITDLKKAEEATLYERNLLRTLIDNLPDSIYVKDKNCKKVIANPIDVKYMGFESEESVIGKTDYDVYPKEIADGAFAEDKSIIETGISLINKEGFFIDNVGEEHWMQNSKVPIKDSKGNIIGLVGIARDITERKREEIRLKLLESVITNATDAVAITKIDRTNSHSHEIIFVNDAYCKMTGYTKNEIIGKEPRILQGPKTDTAELKRISESIKKFEPCEIAVINYKKNGEEFWSSISISPISDNEGNYTHWIAIKRNITERKQMEQAFIKAKEKAEAGSKAKSEFLANMSHEIRTPLNSVIGFSDLLSRTKLDDIQHQYISAVFQSANSLLDIINEILDFSKIEAGKLEIDIDKTDVLDLGYQVSDVISFQAYKKNLELLLNIGNDVPRFIWTDPLRLRQVLVNLMGNAVKFTSQGEIELKIEVIRKELNGKSVLRFSVRDTGIGINPKNQQKVFEAFSQEDASVNRKYGGTGLGLAISKRLLDLMGSELQLHSIPQKGSTFFFELSVKTLDGEALEWSNLHHFKNILIVDDNTNNRRILKDMLSLKGIDTDEAENGIEALQKIISDEKYDVILMDYHMPELDGIETIRRIRKDLKMNSDQQPIMLLHSSAEDESINAACKELDVSQRLVKPIKSKNFFEALSKLHQNKNVNLDIANAPIEKINPRLEYFKVLVVDDNAFNIMLIKTMVNDILPNASIIEAFDGHQAVELYKNEQPDLIFMDIQMPEMNGYEASLAIRSLEKDKKTPIIALTAGTLKDEKERCLEAGMDDYITKPYVTASIMTVINKWLIIDSGKYLANWEI